jgi:hypothetical protein
LQFREGRRKRSVKTGKEGAWFFDWDEQDHLRTKKDIIQLFQNFIMQHKEQE